MDKDLMIKIVTPIEIKGVNRETRTITFVGTSDTKDRSGDIIEAAGWELKNFTANPVFLWSHDGRAMPPIGRAVQVQRTMNSLQFTIEFVPPDILPFADTIFKLYAAGFLKGVSVGFLPKKREMLRDAAGEFIGFRFTQQELIELSAVSVPDNPDALIQESQHGALQKEAAEFLAKSLYAEKNLLNTIHELKGLILQAKGDCMEDLTTDVPDAAGQNTTDKIAATPAEGTDNTVDKRLETVENRLEQLASFEDMQKSATELFSSVKALLEDLKARTPVLDNKFLNVLAPGNAPQGTPENQKELIDAIAGVVSRLREKKWAPTKG